MWIIRAVDSGSILYGEEKEKLSIPNTIGGVTREKIEADRKKTQVLLLPAEPAGRPILQEQNLLSLN